MVDVDVVSSSVYPCVVEIYCLVPYPWLGWVACDWHPSSSGLVVSESMSFGGDLPPPTVHQGELQSFRPENRNQLGHISHISHMLKVHQNIKDLRSRTRFYPINGSLSDPMEIINRKILLLNSHQGSIRTNEGLFNVFPPILWRDWPWLVTAMCLYQCSKSE